MSFFFCAKLLGKLRNANWLSGVAVFLWYNRVSTGMIMTPEIQPLPFHTITYNKDLRHFP